MILTQSQYLLTLYPIRMFYNWTKFSYNIFIFKFKFNFNKYLITKYNNLITNFIKTENLILDSKTQSSTKTRSEVNKSNKKPRSQKGLGKARLGSLKSPLLRGGGIIFGPRYKYSSLTLKTKESKLTKEILLFNKRNRIIIINSKIVYPISNLNEHFKYQLIKLGIPLNSKILFIGLQNIFRSIFLKIKIVTINNLLTLDLLTSDYIILFI